MKLDFTTVGVLMIALSAIQTLFILYFAAVVQHYPGVKRWALGCLAIAVGIALIFLRARIPAPLSLIAGNICIAWGAGCIWTGSVRFTHGIAPRWIPWAASALVGFLFWLFTLPFPTFEGRVTVISLCLATFQGLTAYAFLRSRESRRIRSSRFTGLVFVIQAVVMLLRIPYTFLTHGRDPEASLQTQSLAINLAWILVSHLLTVGFVLMITQRLVVDLRRAASVDFLTGLFNRRAGELRLQAELARSRRLGVGFHLLLLDVDHFKRVNDAHGHGVGDQVLKMVAEVLSGAVRGDDLVCRWGGEEFLVLLSTPDPALAYSAAERLRQGLQDRTFPASPQPIHCTVSIGVGHFLPPASTLDETIRRADAALYQAKHEGRNRVVVWREGMSGHHPVLDL
ncbi:MAG: GGDEF domain-containing protein [Spirochaetes bacterium]|nr:GGDEF domain-containing protein [Spirochaetota bacterium]